MFEVDAVRGKAQSHIYGGHLRTYVWRRVVIHSYSGVP